MRVQLSIFDTNRPAEQIPQVHEIGVDHAGSGANTLFWKFGYWLAHKYRRGFPSLMRDHVRRPEVGQAKTWVLDGQNSRGRYGAVALRRLVTSRKGRFTWRNPAENPFILRDETRRTIESRYADVAFAMSNT